MSTTDPWALPGRTLDITAVSGGGRTTVGLTILGADALATGANGLSPNHFTRDVDGTGAAGTGSMNPIIVTPTQVLLAFPSPVVSVVQGAGYDAYAFSLALFRDGTVCTCPSAIPRPSTSSPPGR